MFKRLCALSNKLDKAGLHDLSDEIDLILKEADTEPNALFNQIDGLFDSLAKAMSVNNMDGNDFERAKSDIVAQYATLYAPGAGDKIVQRLINDPPKKDAPDVAPADPYTEEDRFPGTRKLLEEFDREESE